MVQGRPPGVLSLQEAQAEAKLAWQIHSRHLEVYGELAHLPVPLTVIEHSDATLQSARKSILSRLSERAAIRIKAHLEKRLGIVVSYYPGPPVRGHIALDPRNNAAWSDLLSPPSVLSVATDGWLELFTRLTTMGYLPEAGVNTGLKSLLDPSSACLDGGAFEVISIEKMAGLAPAQQARGLLTAADTLRKTVQVSLGMGESNALVAHLLGTALMTQLREKLEREDEADHKPPQIVYRTLFPSTPQEALALSFEMQQHLQFNAYTPKHPKTPQGTTR